MSTLHQPLKSKDGCFSCHIRISDIHPTTEKVHKLVAEKEKLCERCHKPFLRLKTNHKPVLAGDCTSCHNPHGSNGKNLLDVDRNLTSLCLNCHDPKNFTNEYVHGPVAVGECGACHDPHESSESALLTAPPRETCFKCHTDLPVSLADAPVIHAPVKSEECTACHAPHSSDQPHMLKNTMRALCLECHTQFAGKMTGNVVHKPIEQEESCCSCHAPHYSVAKGLLPGRDQGMCLQCHGKRNAAGSLRNIEAEIKGKKILHGPLRKGECKACHDPHVSPYFRLLRGPYPRELYAPYREGIYGACLNCHDKNLLRYQETSVYTKFRNGKRNLHFTHVAHQRKGRTCRMCHEPHASNGERLINQESISFGVWRIPVNLTITRTGGKCIPGCHREFAYDRENPVTYRTVTSSRRPVLR